MRLLATVLLTTIVHGQAFAQTKPDKDGSAKKEIVGNQPDKDGFVHKAIVEIRPGNKIIQVDKLNLPASTPIKDALVYLPELVNRKNSYIAANYDIQIEGISVGDARDATLSQLHIADVKVIEVNENSLHSVTTYGQGGSINIILKESDENLSGSATLDAAYVQDYVGGILLNHKTEKWSVKALGNVEYYKPEAFKETSSEYGHNELSAENGQRFFSESAQVSAKYQATEADVFKFHFSNVILDQKMYTKLLGDESQTYNDDAKINTCNINTVAEYSHRFENKSSLAAFVRYSYVPETVMHNMRYSAEKEVDNYMTDYDIKAHNLYFKFDYSLPLVKASEVKSLVMNTGLHTTIRNSNNDAIRITENFGTVNLSDERNYFLRPYVTLEGKYKSLSFSGMADFQHYRYKIGMNEKTDFNTVENDLTGMASVLWSVNKRNGLRLSYNHTINRPSGAQLFPYLISDPLESRFVMGNSELRASKLDNVDLDYMLNLSGRGHTLTFNIGADYSYAHDLIQAAFVPVQEGDYSALCYENFGSFNIYRGDLMAYFSKGIFSISLTTNFYVGHDKEGNGTNDFTHFNISLTPSLNFRSGWNGSASVYYNSKIENVYYEVGDLCYANFRLGKTWKHWNVHVFSLVNLNDRAVDRYYNPDGTVYAQKDYDYMKYEVGIGARYSF